jgi:hypothetical protein
VSTILEVTEPRWVACALHKIVSNKFASSIERRRVWPFSIKLGRCTAHVRVLVKRTVPANSSEPRLTAPNGTKAALAVTDPPGDAGKSSVTDENQETASSGDVNRFVAYLAVEKLPVLAAWRELII